MNAKEKKVHFLHVKDTASKLSSICQTTHKHFIKKEKVLIAVPTQEAATYVDQLLWRYPEDSFLPHCIADISCQELIVITTTALNVNKAAILINLCTDIPGNLSEFSIIYDLFDQTHPTKEQLSRDRQSAYQAAGLI